MTSSLAHVTDIHANLIISKPNPHFGNRIYNDNAVYLTPVAAKALQYASDLAQNLDLNLAVLEAYYPIGIQKIMFDGFIQNTNFSKGIAVGMTLQNSKRVNRISQPLTNSGVETCHAFHTDQLSIETIRNRFDLQLVMIASGWHTRKFEWWRFDFISNTHLLNTHDTLTIFHRIRLASGENVIALANKLNTFTEAEAGKIKAAFFKLANISIEELIQCDNDELIEPPKLNTVYPALDERPTGIPGRELDGLLRQLYAKSRQQS
jgi:D-alanyl-D-alanine dipeptidase